MEGRWLPEIITLGKVFIGLIGAVVVAAVWATTVELRLVGAEEKLVHIESGIDEVGDKVHKGFSELRDDQRESFKEVNMHFKEVEKAQLDHNRQDAALRTEVRVLIEKVSNVQKSIERIEAASGSR